MLMYKVIIKFRDKYNPRHFYNVGDIFESDDKNRIKDLFERKLIAKVNEKTKQK